MDVVAFNDHVSDVDANPVENPVIGWAFIAARGDYLVERYCETHGVDHAGEFA